MKKAWTIQVLVVLTLSYLMISVSWTEMDSLLFILLVLAAPVSVVMGVIVIETIRLMAKPGKK